MRVWDRLNGNQKLASALFGLSALFAMGYFGNAHLKNRPELTMGPITPSASEGPSQMQGILSGNVPPPDPNVVVVEVVGAVSKPGVYRLPVGSRVIDALQAAGGTLPRASHDHLNRAAKLVDGSQIEIPLREAAAPTEPATGQRTPSGSARSANASSPRPRSMEGQIPPVTVQPLAAYQSGTGWTYRSSEAKPSQERRTSGAKPKPTGTISLNSASQAQLETLPGVGPATAKKILDYRSRHGGFSSVEELLAVHGIGEKKLAQIRPYVRL